MKLPFPWKSRRQAGNIFPLSAGRVSARSARGERGQSFVELAISLVFLLVLFSVMVDLGYAFYTMITLRDTVQEAATYGAICPIKEVAAVAPNPPTLSRNEALIKERLKVSAIAPIDMKDVTLVTVKFTKANGDIITPPDLPVVGGSVIIEATINHHILVPFAATFIGTTDYPLTVTVAETVVRSKWLAQCEY